jgi:hypothetical protein
VCGGALIPYATLFILTNYCKLLHLHPVLGPDLACAAKLRPPGELACLTIDRLADLTY